jgi:D-alanyl-D-alanine-carboxypeptidase/D-alanyl-D-alanine-endopeptidase
MRLLLGIPLRGKAAVRRWVAPCAFGAFAAFACGPHAPPPAPPPPRAEASPAPPLPADVLAALQSRITSKVYPGVMLGTIEHGDRHYYAFGSSGLASAAPPDEHTVYEIGSLTEVFTSLLLADMVQKGDADFDAPASNYLPAGLSLPSYEGKPITLASLATNTSGLPRLPDNIASADPKNPYADYGDDRLFDFLANYTLTRAPGQRFEASLLGAALLGHVIEGIGHFGYEDLFVTRVAGVLNLDETRITLNPLMASRLAPGSRAGTETGGWDMPAFAGAGALRSTVNDLITFLGVAMGIGQTPLTAPLEVMAQPRAEAGPQLHTGLGWRILAAPHGELVWHAGGTGGYHAFMGFSRASGVGVVLLTNSAASLDDLALHLLDAGLPLEEPPAGGAAPPTLSLARRERIPRG